MQLEGYEFNPFTSRKGKKMFVGELDAYMRDKKSEGAFGETSQHIKCECPYCKNAYKTDHSYSGPYTKYKLYILKDGSSGWCFRCDQGFINMSDEATLSIKTPEPPISMQDFNLTKLPEDGVGWTLDRFYDLSEFDEEGFNYLIHKRHHYMKNLASALKIRYFEHNPVIPFYYHGQLIFYQLKIINPKMKTIRRKNSDGVFVDHVYQEPKYFTPPINHKPPYIIEHGDNKKFILCEGTFDAISLLVQAPSYTPMALLGSTITDYQLTMLRTYVPDKILIYMDESKLSYNVADRIRRYINYADIDIIKSGGMDPEEMLQKRIAEEQPIQWIK